MDAVPVELEEESAWMDTFNFLQVQGMDWCDLFNS